jgi:hypothetical protein
MRSGTQPSENGEDGRVVLEVMLAAYASAAEGRKIKMPYRPPAGVKVPVEPWLNSRKG